MPSLLRLSPLASLLLALSWLLPAHAADFDCRFETQGRTFDLNAVWQSFGQSGRLLRLLNLDEQLSDPLYHTYSYESPPTTSKTTYALSICSPLPRQSKLEDRDQCPEGTRACFTTVNSKQGEQDRVTTVIPIAGGIGDLNPSVQWSSGKGSDGKTQPDRLLVAFHAGSYLGRTRWANLTFFCNPNRDTVEPESWNYQRTETEGILSVEWVTKYGCPTDSSSAPPGSSPGNSPARRGGGIGGFFASFFLFIFLLLVAYFILGAYYQYSQYGSRGWDLLPNRAFWADLPYVLRDLFRGTGRNSAGYSSL